MVLHSLEDPARIPPEPDGHPETDPYEAHLVSRELRILKAPLMARPVGILTNSAKGRSLRLINPASRVIRANDVHELTCTTEDCALGEVVNEVGYLAFALFGKSGVLARGDMLQVDGVTFGTVIGFNEVHMPNHVNIILRVNSLTTGLDEGWSLETRLVFRRPAEEEVKQNSRHRRRRKRSKNQ